VEDGKWPIGTKDEETMNREPLHELTEWPELAELAQGAGTMEFLLANMPADEIDLEPETIVKVSTGSNIATRRIIEKLHQMGHHSIASELAKRNTGRWCYVTVTESTLAIINKAREAVELDYYLSY
jgi:hypothetical protein